MKHIPPPHRIASRQWRALRALFPGCRSSRLRDPRDTVGVRRRRGGRRIGALPGRVDDERRLGGRGRRARRRHVAARPLAVARPLDAG